MWIFGPILTFHFLLKMTKIKKVNISRKKNILQVVQISQNQGPVSSQYSMKNTITFCTICVFG